MKRELGKYCFRLCSHLVQEHKMCSIEAHFDDSSMQSMNIIAIKNFTWQKLIRTAKDLTKQLELEMTSAIQTTNNN